MKKHFLKPFTLKLITSFVLIIVAFVIHSCQKDNKSDSQIAPAIIEAKTWYESAYPVNNSGNSKLLSQSIGGAHDLSQLIKPDWEHSTSYTRLGQKVIELPVDPRAKLALTLKTNKWIFNKAYSRSYYLLINDGKKYDAYILTIIADSDYVKNDLTKLANNTYRKHDDDFSGLVLYFTPKGTYLGGYSYKNGKLFTPATTSLQTGSQKTQSINYGQLKPNNMVEHCTDWYQQVTIYYQDGSSTTGPWEYLDTTCIYSSDGSSGSGGTGGGSSGSGIGSTGGGDSSPASPPPPPPCPAGSHPGPPTTSPCTPAAVDAITGGQLKTQYVQPPPPGDGGLPPPPAQGACSVNSPAAPCPVTIDSSLTVPNVDPAASDFIYTCPDNFSFVSVTTNNLWQEGVLTNIHCTLSVINPYTNQITNVRSVTIQQVNFGLAYYNIEGNIVFTQNQAKEIAADAFNQAEADMRKKYKSNVNLSSSQLASFWIGRMNFYMGSITLNRGKAGITGSINPANIPPSRAYNPCD